jgi:phosphatidylserine/phosphatidylglycerophosphate/cardiolipin synthase-like enzyme
MGNAIDDPLNDIPPGFLNKAAFVNPDIINTIRIMNDPQDAGFARWFATGGGMQDVISGNEVSYLIDGVEAFPAMVEAIQRATDGSKRHFIYIVAWAFQADFQLVPGKAGTKYRELLEAAASRGVEIRALLWANILNNPVSGSIHDDKAENFGEVQMINGLKTGKAILDSRTLFAGVHHQKLLVVNGDDGLVAFCGGVDPNADRINPPDPLHDVHVRIRGPVARNLLHIFIQRWLDHPKGRTNPPLAGMPLLGASQPSRGRMRVQVGRTYPKGVYSFAPDGEQTAKRIIATAIQQARKFIYLEDQYLVNMECSNLLKAALPNVQYIVVFIPGDGSVDKELGEFNVPEDVHVRGVTISTGRLAGPLLRGQAKFRRAQFIENIKSGPRGLEKLHVFEGLFGTGYVHAKLYIIDDEFAIVGSANCNRRGWEHDSELMVGIHDGSTNDHYALSFAHRLRIRLWARHLNMRNAEGFAQLVDGVASVGNWLRPPPGAKIAPYFTDLSVTTSPAERTEWDNVVDPPSPLGIGGIPF